MPLAILRPTDDLVGVVQGINASAVGSTQSAQTLIGQNPVHTKSINVGGTIRLTSRSDIDILSRPRLYGITARSPLLVVDPKRKAIMPRIIVLAQNHREF